MCFLGETRDYLGGVFCPGNHTSAYKAKDFLKAMLQKLPENKVIRLRADSGFQLGSSQMALETWNRILCSCASTALGCKGLSLRAL